MNNNKENWTRAGSELDGALAIQALLETGTDWEDLAFEAQKLSQWAMGEALWQGATVDAKRSLEQSCRVAQIASHLISIGWSAIQSDLPAFLDALVIDNTLKQESLTLGNKIEESATEFNPISEEMKLLKGVKELSLKTTSVVGNYRRYDSKVRRELNLWKERILNPISKKTTKRENFLIWAEPGSGKSFFIQEISRIAGKDVSYFEINLARLSKAEFNKKLDDVKHELKPTICLLDEIDSRNEESWPYESCFSMLDINYAQKRKIVFILIGSSSNGLRQMSMEMSNRSKGKDLLDRIPVSNRFEIPGLVLGDQIIIAVSHFFNAFKERGKILTEVDKFALYYILSSNDVRTPRQIRELAISAVDRISDSSSGVLYSDLFYRGDRRLQDFWTSNITAVNLLGDESVIINN